MVIDASALIAILKDESDRNHFLDRIEAATDRLLSAATLVETSIVLLARRGERGLAIFSDLLFETGIEIVPLTAEHAALAVDAFRRFGRGRHPAALNFGDCFSYALARAAGEPLLFKGKDFELTDIERAA